MPGLGAHKSQSLSANGCASAFAKSPQKDSGVLASTLPVPAPRVQALHSESPLRVNCSARPRNALYSCKAESALARSGPLFPGHKEQRQRHRPSSARPGSRLRQGARRL